MKRTVIFLFLFLITGMGVFAQVGINTDNSAPDPSAGLDVKFNNKGVLLPRITYIERNAIVSPAEGLMVYCTNCDVSGNGVVSIFQDGKWRIIDLRCQTPGGIFQGTHISSVNQITWNWNPVPIADGYKWNTADNYFTAIDVGTATSYTETGLACVTPYTRYVWAYNDCGYSQWYSGGPGPLTDTTISIPFTAPDEGIHVPTSYQVVWNWNSVEGALGYKWNVVNNYNTAIDMGTGTSKTEPGVNCGAALTRYVWAYSTCGISTATVLTQLSTACPENCLPLTDVRDGKTYSTVLIGTQCWMRENLNIGTLINNVTNQTNNGIIEKYCYNDLEANCTIYGGLYQWDEMMNYTTSRTSNTSGSQGICPAGWHVPSDAEWTQLTTFLGGESMPGGKMKEPGTAHWLNPNTGATNSSGFTALPGGFSYTGGYDGGEFIELSSHAYFWSAVESSSTDVSCWFLSYFSAQVYSTNYYRETDGLSARCCKD